MNITKEQARARAKLSYYTQIRKYQGNMENMPDLVDISDRIKGRNIPKIDTRPFSMYKNRKTEYERRAEIRKCSSIGCCKDAHEYLDYCVGCSE